MEKCICVQDPCTHFSKYTDLSKNVKMEKCVQRTRNFFYPRKGYDRFKCQSLEKVLKDRSSLKKALLYRLKIKTIYTFAMNSDEMILGGVPSRDTKKFLVRCTHFSKGGVGSP